MKCVVLVGGEGTRLRPLTYTTPKQMLPVVAMPMIERVLSELECADVDTAVLSLGYKPDAFVDAYPEGRARGITLEYAVEPEPLGTAGAIAFAARESKLLDTFLVVNGDVLTDIAVDDLIEFHRRSGAEATIALTPVDDPSAFGVVPTDEQGRVTAFIEKPDRDAAPTNFINAGIYVLEPGVVERIAVDRPVSIEREIFPQLVESGTLLALKTDAYWIDAGTPEVYLRAHRDLLSGARTSPPHPEAVEHPGGIWTIGSPVLDGEVRGPSLIADGAVIAGGATVVASTVGFGAVVAPGATVSSSVVHDGATIGNGATVDNSIVGRGARIGDGARVTDVSVVGAAFELAGGSTLRGARVP